MKIGLVGRSEQRGLGIQTFEFARHMPVEKVLHVSVKSKWVANPKIYDDYCSNVVDVPFANELPASTVEEFLDGLDVVFSAETFYDWTLIDVANRMGVKTVCQGNPEFYRHNKELKDVSHPTSWWWPTSWMVEQMPSGPVVPVPVPDDAPLVAGSADDDVFTVVHVAGHRASADRNGTELFMQSLRYVTSQVRVRVFGQDGALPSVRTSKGVELERVPSGADSRWDMFRGAHLVMLPRRYGGNCLPAYEAMASGCALAMTQCAPNVTWPIIPITSVPGQSVTTPFGPIRTFNAKPQEIAKIIDRLSVDRDMLGRQQRVSSDWAEMNKWRHHRTTYMSELEAVL